MLRGAVVDTPDVLTDNLQDIVSGADVVIIPVWPMPNDIEPFTRTGSILSKNTKTPVLIVVNEYNRFRMCASFMEWLEEKQDMAEMLDKFEANAAKEHDKKGAKVSVAADVSEGRATSLVSMTKSDKERLTAIAKTHGLSLSAFFRLAANEYIANHDW